MFSVFNIRGDKHEAFFGSSSGCSGEFDVLSGVTATFINFLQASGKIVFEKWDIQAEAKFAEIKHEIKDSSSLSVDIHALNDADDIVVINSILIKSSQGCTKLFSLKGSSSRIF